MSLKTKKKQRKTTVPDSAETHAFIGEDTSGAACIYIQYLTEDGEHIRYVDLPDEVADILTDFIDSQGALRDQLAKELHDALRAAIDNSRRCMLG